MSKFNAFKFVSSKKYGKKPSEDDMNNFSNYMVCRICSFDDRLTSAMRFLNTTAFNHYLSPRVQCLTYNFLNGVDVKYNMVNPPRKTAYDRDVVNKVMSVMQCSMRKAEEHIEDGFIDIDELIEYYDIVHTEPKRQR